MEQGLGTAWLEETLELAERAGCREDPATLERIRIVALLGDPDAGVVLQGILRRAAVPHIIDGNPFFPPPTRQQLAGRGGFPFGSCPFTGNPNLFPVNEERGNILIEGTVGCGKTTAVCHLALGLASSRARVHIDVPRADYRPLAKYHGFRLATVRTCRMNIIASIKNVPTNVQAQSFAEVTAHHLDFRTRGKQAVARRVEQLGEHFGKSGHDPCVADLVEYLKQMSFQSGSYEKECAARVIERLESCIRHTGQMLLCQDGHHYEETPGPIVFEMALEPQLRDYLTELRIRREFLYRHYNSEAGLPRLYEVVDEAMNLGRERRYSSTSREMSTASMDVTATQARYHRMHLVFVTQVITNVSSAIKATSTLRLGGTTLADQLYETAKLLGLDREQPRWLARLPRGTFVVRGATDRLPRPYLVEFSRFEELDERIGEAEAEKLSERSTRDLPWQPRWVGSQQAIRALIQGVEPSDVPERVFHRIAEHPDEACAERCAALAIDAATESAARRDLGPDGGLGLIELDGKVGNRLFVRLTAKGRAAAEQKGYKVWRSHASPTHSWLVQQCLRGLGQAGSLRALRMESALNGRRPDALCEVSGTCVALQVCSSSGNYRREAQALLDLAEASGIDLAVLVATHRRHAEGIRKVLGEKLADVGWEHIAVLDAQHVLKPNFSWTGVLGGA